MPSRRSAITVVLSAMASVAAATGNLPGQDDTPQAASEVSKRLPNIVVLYADDLGYGDLGCYNRRSKIATPHLDALAAQGLRCTDAHSSSGICTPSRYALLTGRHHWRDFHDIVDSFGPSVFAKGRRTLGTMLQDAGYTTACIGKWHLGWDWQAIRKPDAKPNLHNGKHHSWPADAFDWQRAIPGGPLAHGFGHYFGDDVPNFPPYAWIRDDRVLVAPTVPYAPNPKPPEGSDEGRAGPMVDGWRLDAVMPKLSEHAVAWLESQRDAAKPFFLYFPFTSPHAPIVPSEEWLGRSKAGPYGDFVAQTDATVGAVLAALDRIGANDDTLVIFSADNGPEAYAWERVRKHDHRSMGELRGLKRDVWEGGHRVPFLVRWPGRVPAGTTSDALLSQTDLYATVATIVGANLRDDEAEDSFDQGPVWRGEVASVRDFAVHNTYAGKFALREGHWLYLTANDGGHRQPPPWFAEQEGYEPATGDCALYDLRSDPGQKHNLAAERPGVVAAMAKTFAAIRIGKGTAPRLRR